MAISKITTRGMSGDTLEAGDIAANAIGASELADNAVDTAAIAATSITEAKLNADVTDGSAITTSVKPHIELGTLYPAWQGYLSDTTPAHTFTDSGATGHTILGVGASNYGNASGISHVTGNKKIGNTSIEIKGAGNSLEIAEHADWDFGSGGDFTIEGWVYYENNGAANNYDNIWLQTGSFQIGRQQSSNKLYSFTGSNSGGESSGTLTDGTWHHIAVCRHSGTLYGYVGGVKKFEYSDTTDIDYAGAAYIGNSSTAQTSHWNFDQFRLSNNARYPSGTTFTPSTTAYSSDANTKLLIQSNVASSALHSGAYGTAQSDGKKYYYTDIKGSKPIKDPRIGAHFGSQRHLITSTQLLEQETAAHSTPIYSIDGREWMRVNTDQATIDKYDTYGLRLYANNWGTTSEFIEVVGYFNSINIGGMTWDAASYGVKYSLNGAAYTNATNSFVAGASTPTGGRYVNASSLLNLPVGATLGINTVKINTGASVHSIELIAQDTTSTATKSKIQIPAQNVVSYGKKFPVSAAAHHYDPFNGFTNSSGNAAGLHSTYVDTATSLGLDTAPGSSAKWAISSTNNIRPYNGGRVVKWIASDGTIKTSVTMMPPNAQNIKALASNEITTPSATNTTITPNMSNDVIDHSLSEFAKIFHYREFGNGGGNGNASYKDMTSKPNEASAQDTSYIMDDGLTSFQGSAYVVGTGNIDWDVSDYWYWTFIGTGFSWEGTGTWKNNFLAQNLPYGTHIVKFQMNGSSPWSLTLSLDGISLGACPPSWMNMRDLTIHQPKKPPIPEDAVVIADYILMADYVKSTNTTQKIDDLSKGIRLQAISKDVFFDRTGGSWDGMNYGSYISNFITPHVVAGGNATSLTAKLPYFGFTKGALSARRATDATDLAVTATNASGSLESTNVTVSTRVIPALSANVADLSHTGNVYGFFNWEKSDGELGNNIVSFDDANLTSTFDWMYLSAMEISSPIHTSSHYQTFESPYLKELVGGDRNMEQTNLVVTADGKTWDEVTRNTSYLGNMVLSSTTDTNYNASNNNGIVLDEWRGIVSGGLRPNFNKDFAIAYDGLVCLKDDQYTIFTNSIGSEQGYVASIYLNGSIIALTHAHTDLYYPSSNKATLSLKRGDEISVRQEWHGSAMHISYIIIERS